MHFLVTALKKKNAFLHIYITILIHAPSHFVKLKCL